ncbi:hypothetical protein ACKKBG_A27360 [Auxenochlorella protothecoides x Auxenochlorella symbiontica]
MRPKQGRKSARKAALFAEAGSRTTSPDPAQPLLRKLALDSADDTAQAEERVGAAPAESGDEAGSPSASQAPWRPRPEAKGFGLPLRFPSIGQDEPAPNSPRQDVMSLVDAELATARAGNKLRRHAPAEPPTEGEFSIKSAREHVAAPASLALQNAFAALHSGATSPAGSIGASGAGEDAGDGEEETKASSSSDAGGSTDQYESAAPSRMASALTAFASAASLGSPLAPQRRSSGSEGEDAATSALRGARPAEARHTPSGLQRCGSAAMGSGAAPGGLLAGLMGGLAARAAAATQAQQGAGLGGEIAGPSAGPDGCEDAGEHADHAAAAPPSTALSPRPTLGGAAASGTPAGAAQSSTWGARVLAAQGAGPAGATPQRIAVGSLHALFGAVAAPGAGGGANAPGVGGLGGAAALNMGQSTCPIHKDESQAATARPGAKSFPQAISPASAPKSDAAARQGACGRPAAPAVVASPGSQGPRNLFARHGFLPNALDMTCLQQAEGGRPQPGAMESPLKSAATVAPNPAPWGPGGEGAQSLWAAPLAADGTLPSSPFASPHAQRDADEARRAHVSHKTADTVKGRPSAAPRGRLPLAWGQSPGREGGLTAGASPGGVREAAGQLQASPGGAEGVPGRRPEDASPRGFPRTLANPLWHAPEPQPAPAQPAGGLPDNPWSSLAPVTSAGRNLARLPPGATPGSPWHAPATGGLDATQPSPGAQEPAPRVSSGPSSPEPVPLGARSPQPSSARGLAAAATSRLASLFSAVTRSSPTRGEAAAAAKAHLPAGAVAVPGSVSAANNVEAGGDVARMQADAKAWAKAHADKLASAGHTADAVDPGQAPGMPGIAEATGAEEGAETPAAPSQRHSRRFSLAMDESLAEALDSPVRQEETANGAALLAGFARRLGPLTGPGAGATPDAAAAESPLHTATSSQHGASLLTGGEAFSDARGTSLTPSTAAPQARPLLSPVQRQGPASSPAAGGGVSPRWPGAAEAPRDLRLSDETLRRRERAAATAAAAAGAHPHAVVDQVPAAATRSPSAGQTLPAAGLPGPAAAAGAGMRAVQPSAQTPMDPSRSPPFRHSQQPGLGRGPGADNVPREQLLQAEARARVAEDEAARVAQYCRDLEAKVRELRGEVLELEGELEAARGEAARVPGLEWEIMAARREAAAAGGGRASPSKPLRSSVPVAAPRDNHGAARREPQRYGGGTADRYGGGMAQRYRGGTAERYDGGTAQRYGGGAAPRHGHPGAGLQGHLATRAEPLYQAHDWAGRDSDWGQADDWDGESPPHLSRAYSDEEGEPEHAYQRQAEPWASHQATARQGGMGHLPHAAGPSPSGAPRQVTAFRPLSAGMWRLERRI